MRASIAFKYQWKLISTLVSTSNNDEESIIDIEIEFWWNCWTPTLLKLSVEQVKSREVMVTLD